MPIRPDLLHHYRGPAWRAIRNRIIVEREHNRCQHCHREQGAPYYNPKRKKWIITLLGCAHLDQDPANNADANLASLCRACHMKHDIAWHVAHARVTRQTRKDAARPLLAEAAL